MILIDSKIHVKPSKQYTFSLVHLDDINMGQWLEACIGAGERGIYLQTPIGCVGLKDGVTHTSSKTVIASFGKVTPAITCKPVNNVWRSVTTKVSKYEIPTGLVFRGNEEDSEYKSFWYKSEMGVVDLICPEKSLLDTDGNFFMIDFEVEIDLNFNVETASITLDIPLDYIPCGTAFTGDIDNCVGRGLYVKVGCPYNWKILNIRTLADCWAKSEYICSGYVACDIKVSVDTGVKNI